MKLSFIILTYKDIDHLRVCLRNIKQLGLSFPFEIILVDNAQSKEVASLAQAYASSLPLRYIQNTENIGHPAGNNVGLRVASGEFVAVINPDIIFRSADDVWSILRYLEQNSDVAFVGPKLRNVDGTIQPSCYRTYSAWTPLYRRTILGKLPFAKRDINRHLMTDFDHNTIREVDWLLGACLFIRRSVLSTIGFMDERLFLYFGDYEWCDRARRNGWKVVYYANSSQIYHYHKRESAASRFTMPQLFSYVTRVHIKDWLTYRSITSHYAKSS